MNNLLLWDIISLNLCWLSLLNFNNINFIQKCNCINENLKNSVVLFPFFLQNKNKNNNSVKEKRNIFAASRLVKNCWYHLWVAVREHVFALFLPHVIGSNLLCDIVATRGKTASRTWFPCLWRCSFFFFFFPFPLYFLLHTTGYTLGSKERFSCIQLDFPFFVSIRRFCSHRLLNNTSSNVMKYVWIEYL